MKSLTVARVVCALVAASMLMVGHGSVQVSGQTSAYGLTIPSAHPRLWWNAERRARAATWLQNNPFSPRSSEPLGQAFRCVITGEAEYCQSAVNYAMNQLCTNAACTSPDPNVGVASNDARWEGENVILVFDWCYQYFTPAQRATLINRWNTYFHNIRQHTWGGPTQYQSNFNWGYMRNEIEWGIATWGENAQADANLQHGLVTRWQSNAVPHFQAGGRGGVFQEGSVYGSALGHYSVVPFGSAALLGRDVARETNFFREAVMYMVDSTLPAPTYNRNNGGSFYEIFPFADDERFYDGGVPARNYGGFMQHMADYWRDVPIGGLARQWLNMVNPALDPHIAAVDRGGAAASFASLPLDYYASGPRYFFSRDKWNTSATALLLQLGVTEDEGHQHTDVGTWQMWRNGRWLSRESTGYVQSLLGFGGEMVETDAAIAHNSLLVNGRGPSSNYHVGESVVRRLESRPNYSYINVNLTPVYRSTRASFDNPAVSYLEREFLFLRPFETLVVFDRIESSSATATKQFIAHFETSPTVDAANRVVTAVNGSQALRVTTLVPAAPTYRPIVNEGGQVGQYRLEVEAPGGTQSYFLNVLQAKGVTDSNITTSVVDSGAAYVLTITHPTLGSSSITFQKGRSSAGGAITIAGATTALSTTVQSVTVNDAGVTWGGAAGTQLPNAPGNLRVIP